MCNNGIFISFLFSVTVSSGGVNWYELSMTPQLSGVYQGHVTFTAPSGDHDDDDDEDCIWRM
jgi:hypothetical protein